MCHVLIATSLERKVLTIDQRECRVRINAKKQPQTNSEPLSVIKIKRRKRDPPFKIIIKINGLDNEVKKRKRKRSSPHAIVSATPKQSLFTDDGVDVSHHRMLGFRGAVQMK